MGRPASNWKPKRERLKQVKDIFASTNKISGGKLPELERGLSEAFLWLSFCTLKDIFISGNMLVTSGRRRKKEGQSAKEAARPVFKKASPETVSRDFCLYCIGWNWITWPPSSYSARLGKQVSLFPTSILGKKAGWTGGQLTESATADWGFSSHWYLVTWNSFKQKLFSSEVPVEECNVLTTCFLF